MLAPSASDNGTSSIPYGQCLQNPQHPGHWAAVQDQSVLQHGLPGFRGAAGDAHCRALDEWSRSDLRAACWGSKLGIWWHRSEWASLLSGGQGLVFWVFLLGTEDRQGLKRGATSLPIGFPSSCANKASVSLSLGRCGRRTCTKKGTWHTSTRSLRGSPCPGAGMNV